VAAPTQLSSGFKRHRAAELARLDVHVAMYRTGVSSHVASTEANGTLLSAIVQVVGPLKSTGPERSRTGQVALSS
jgi:hypothetical protein